jgi:excinuclease UvrABC nuclease subunit
VYLIYKNNKLVYVGMSQSDVYKTMYRHFQSWEDPFQIRVTYTKRMNCACRVVLCTAAQALNLEKALILKYRPKDNPNKYNNRPVKPTEKRLLDEFTGTAVESCPF